MLTQWRPGSHVSPGLITPLPQIGAGVLVGVCVGVFDGVGVGDGVAVILGVGDADATVAHTPDAQNAVSLELKSWLGAGHIEPSDPATIWHCVVQHGVLQ